MTEKVKKFCDKYFETLHGTNSAIYAGFSEKTARSQASQMLDTDEVIEYLAELRNIKAIETGITQSWVMERFKMISDNCVAAEPILNRFGAKTGEYRFDSSGANKATEMLGRIIGIFQKDNEQSNKILVGKDLSDEEYK